jgi:integrase
MNDLDGPDGLAEGEGTPVDEELWSLKVVMKGRVEHAVLLTPRAVATLREVRGRLSKERVRLPRQPGLPLSDKTLTKVLRDARLNGRATAHGFRSSFKDWCAEVAKVRDEVSEAALV